MRSMILIGAAATMAALAALALGAVAAGASDRSAFQEDSW